MKALIIGCGRIGSELGYRLFQKGHEVSIVDNVAASFGNLPADFKGRINEGDALNQDVLIRAGIKNCDVLAAVTNNDALNLVVSHIAKCEYNIENVIARNYDPHTLELFQVFNIQVISSTSWGAQRIEELMYHSDARTVFSAGNGEVEVYELTIPVQWSNRKIKDLNMSNECKPIALTRGGKAEIPDLTSMMLEGDILTVAATFDGIEEIRKDLTSSTKEG